MCHHSQSESIEWEKEFEKFWKDSSILTEGYFPYRDDVRGFISQAITTAVAKREQEILEEAKKKISSAGGIGGWKHLEDILDEVILKH